MMNMVVCAAEDAVSVGSVVSHDSGIGMVADNQMQLSKVSFGPTRLEH